MLGSHGPVACGLCFCGFKKQGGKAGSFFFCSTLVLDFATNKGFNFASRKSWIFNSSGISGCFRNLVGSIFTLVLGASHTKKILFFTLFWIQGSIEARRINVSCSCIENKYHRAGSFWAQAGKWEATQRGEEPLVTGHCGLKEWVQGTVSEDSFLSWQGANGEIGGSCLEEE